MATDEQELNDADGEEVEEEIQELMENHDIDKDKAEKIKELMDDEGLDEDEAIELEELF